MNWPNSMTREFRRVAASDRHSTCCFAGFGNFSTVGRFYRIGNRRSPGVIREERCLGKEWPLAVLCLMMLLRCTRFASLGRSSDNGDRPARNTGLREGGHALGDGVRRRPIRDRFFD